jgi:adenylosuccinate lyase
VGEAARASADQGTFRDALLGRPEVGDRLGTDGLERALDPRHYLGVSEELISRALAAHHRLGTRA